MTFPTLQLYDFKSCDLGISVIHFSWSDVICINFCIGEILDVCSLSCIFKLHSCSMGVNSRRTKVDFVSPYGC